VPRRACGRGAERTGLGERSEVRLGLDHCASMVSVANVSYASESLNRNCRTGSSCCFHVSRPARIALTTHCLSTTAGACAPLTLYLQAFALRQRRSRRACCPDPSRRPASGVGRPTSSGREEGSKAKEGGRTKLRRRVERAPFGGWDGAKGELKVDRGGRWQLGRCRS
jgi:hypothetical protein